MNHTKNNQKLVFLDLPEPELELFALKSSVEDYRIVYMMNKELRTKFSKVNEDIELNDDTGKSFFSNFFYYDEKNRINWRLIDNRSLSHLHTQAEVNHPLFKESEFQISTSSFFIPELKAFDYLLLIEEVDAFFELQEVLYQLQQLKCISAIHQVRVENLKSKNNLIF